MAEKKNPLGWQGAMGLTGVLVWMFMFGIVEYANDMLMAKRGSEALWSNVYQVSAGYVLGFVAAIAIWLLWRLTQGAVPEMLSEAPWARWLTTLGLVGAIASALAGLVMPNMGGLKLTYDIAFVIAILVVYTGVIPLYKTWKS